MFSNTSNTSSFSLSGFNSNANTPARNTGAGVGGASSGNTSLFGGNTTSNTPNMSGSITSNSIFGSQQQQPQQQQQQNQQLVPSGQGMTHSQSTLDLNSSMMSNNPSPSPYGTRHIANTPSWGKQDRRKVPSHISTLRPQSSFTPDRNSMGSSVSRHGSISAAQSPPNTFSGSFGTAKPIQAKKSNVIDEEDLPPTESIYDMGASPFLGSKRQVSNGSITSSSPNKALPMSNSTIGLRRLSSSSNRQELALPDSGTPSTPSNSNNYQNCAVVVFGFPPALTPTVIKHFSKFGTILENFDSSKGESPRRGGSRGPPIQTGPNWMKLTYDNPTSAAKAISHTSGGSTFIGGCAIACIPYNSANSKEFGNMNMPDDIIQEEQDDQVMDIDSPPPEKKFIQQDGKALPRTISMPTLGNQSATPNSRRLQVKDGKSIFNNKQRTVRFAPSMGNMHAKDSESKLKPARQGWLSWTTKRAQELVFGWDDL